MYVFLFLTGVGILFFLLGFWAKDRAKRRDTKETTVSAKVIDRRRVGRRNGSVTYLTFEYEVGNRVYQQEIGANNISNPPKAGTVMLIGYDPSDPERIRLLNSKGYTVFYGLGVTFIIVGIIVLIIWIVN